MDKYVKQIVTLLTRIRIVHILKVENIESHFAN